MLVMPLFAEDKAEVGAPMVHVGGQVGKPGSMEYRENTTVFSMVFAAGGPTKFGAMQRVKVFRKGRMILVDLTDDKQKSKLLAKPNDYIEVPAKNLLGR